MAQSFSGSQGTDSVLSSPANEPKEFPTGTLKRTAWSPLFGALQQILCAASHPVV